MEEMGGWTNEPQRCKIPWKFLQEGTEFYQRDLQQVSFVKSPGSESLSFCNCPSPDFLFNSHELVLRPLGKWFKANWLKREENLVSHIWLKMGRSQRAGDSLSHGKSEQEETSEIRSIPLAFQGEGTQAQKGAVAPSRSHGEHLPVTPRPASFQVYLVTMTISGLFVSLVSSDGW